MTQLLERTPAGGATTDEPPSLRELVLQTFDDLPDPDAVAAKLAERFGEREWRTYGPLLLRRYVSWALNSTYRAAIHHQGRDAIAGPSRGERLARSGVTRFLQAHICVDGVWLQVRDMSAQDWDTVAAAKRELVEQTLHEAERAEHIARLMRKHKAKTTAALPPEVLMEAIR